MGFEVLTYHNLVTIVAWSNEQMDRFRQGCGVGGGRAVRAYRHVGPVSLDLNGSATVSH